MTEDNNPDIILKLVARTHRAHVVWADRHNESFYLPPRVEVTKKGPQEVVVNPDGTSRQPTPSSEDVRVSEPALQIDFSKKPKKPELGYVLGSDRKSCDILLGLVDDCISNQMFAVSFNQYNEVVMKSSAKNATVVKYGRRIAKRTNFTWIFPPGQEEIFVSIANTIEFSVEVPTHEKDKIAYEAKCRNFMMQANSGMVTIDLLNLSSRPETKLVSGVKTSHAAAEPPFYLQTEQIGEGGFGMVYKARSMPNVNGKTVALKKFKSKNAWTLEADVLRKLATTPHDNIVEFIDFGVGDEPYLVMGLALGGTLEQQYKFMPFTTREVALILRQMLEALVYLHVDFDITHRDIKPANILCDSRAHFRLADFGLAKEGDVLKTFNGTKPYMAPEMFVSRLYTSKIDVWALGMVISRLLVPNRPPGFKGHEGPRWCAAVVAQFQNYEECCQAIGSNSLEQAGLNLVVGQYMLKMNPEDRESAPGCLERGNFLWWVLDQEGDDGAKTPTQDLTESVLNAPHIKNARGPSKEDGWTEESGASECNGALEEESAPEEEVGGPFGMNEFLGDNESEADTEILGKQSLNSDEWLSLEREFQIDEANGGGNAFSSLQHFAHAPSVNPSENVWEDFNTPGSSGDSEVNPSRHKEAQGRHKRTSQGSRPLPPAAPMGVRKSVHKRNKSSLAKSVAAAGARQAAKDQSQSDSEVLSAGEELSQNASQFTSTGEELSQSEADPTSMDEEELSHNGEEPSLEDGYRPGQPGHLINPYNRAFIGAGETVDEWIIGRGSWPGET